MITKKTYHIILISCILFLSHSLLAQELDSLEYKPSLKVKALIQTRYESTLTDNVNFSNQINPDAVNNNFRIRRAEIRTDYSFNPNLKGVIRVQIPALKSSAPGTFLELAYIEWRFKEAFVITAGQFKVPFDLDELTSHTDLRMIDRGTTSSLISANSQASYQPGIMITGSFNNERPVLNYYFAIQNGSNRAVNFDIDNKKNVTARLEYFLYKELRLGGNVQLVGLNEDNALGFGGDISLQKRLNTKNLLIAEASYSQGVNSSIYLNDTAAIKELDNYMLNGYFGQLVWKTDIMKKWCRTFELGGKYELTDPLLEINQNAFSVITGIIGFNFLPNNTARLQLQIENFIFEKEIPGVTKNFTRFVTQFQLYI
ncbi:MAG: hypothetical protein IPG60_04195 [Bacteroidetes bacterium]|nr:hypothetical protein [Bacteroidota bacterium]MBP7397954.1 hypothetical protein [Chitinophagales bacterium]MBK7108912.1 hypothetical protein [Bacteroidota bacterium]MBK8488762.1 hypothetical protein [Bacteroidota bacterium]MBK8681481.1 hypothetical protein [Bacteroidota bacterium]